MHLKFGINTFIDYTRNFRRKALLGRASVVILGKHFPSLTFLFLETMLETSKTTIRKLERFLEYMSDKFEVLMS